MGGGSWSNVNYTARTTSKLADHGTAFVYDRVTKDTKPRSAWTAHEDLDPKRTNKAGDHAGEITRESLDSEEHPETLPIAVFFDVTGSMGHLPKLLQAKLPELHGMLVRKGYVDHPQVLFGGIGDAFSDQVPLQVSQFESDNRMDQHLENMLLEGGGGGGNHESYDLAAYFLARHTYLDSLEKRGKRGYAFFIGDERAYRNVDPTRVREYIGDELQGPLDTETIFAELQESFHTFYLFAQQGAYEASQVVNEDYGDAIGWRRLLGQNALILDDVGAVCETIALTIGVMEGRISLDAGLEDLAEVSTDLKAVTAAGKAVAAVGAGSGGGADVVPSDSFEGGGESGTEAL